MPSSSVSRWGGRPGDAAAASATAGDGGDGGSGSRSRSISPMPPGGSTTTTATSNNSSNLSQNQQKYFKSAMSNNNNDKSNIPNIPFPDDEPDFELIESVEWSTDENASPFDELAVKPKRENQSNDDPCMCPYPYDADPNDKNFKCCNDLSCVLFACQEECRSNCPTGEFCGNKRIQRKEWKQVEVFPAGKKGKGLRILEDATKGDLISEYVGRAVNKAFLNRLFRRYTNERKLYIMALDTNIYLDARKKGGLARYINHSCEPNCKVERWMVRGILRAAIVALKDITAGTELSFDYQWERKRGRAPTKCHCGSKLCRGTLEVPKSMEDEALERKLSNHWKKPLIMRAGKEIINRCIRIFSKDSQEYYPADVTQYDESTGQHLVMYRHDLEEVWEDLKKEDWMILDEEAEQFIIRKKLPPSDRSKSKSATSLISGVGPPPPSSLLLANTIMGMNNNNNNNNYDNNYYSSFATTPSLLFAGGNGPQRKAAKNYVYLQTPIKEAMVSKELIERCQRSCRVTITPQQFARPPLPPAPAADDNTDNTEDIEKFAALDRSLDGTVWKLSIVGSDVSKAHAILTKNIAYLENKLGLGGGGGGGASGGGISGSGGDLAHQAGGLGGETNQFSEPATEVILPRLVVEAVKKRMPLIRDKISRAININFAPSESKSKQFAKLLIEGSLQSDIQAAKEHLWNQLNVACEEMKAPKTLSGVYKDLGFLGGELSSSDFYRLLEYDKTTSYYKYTNNTQDAKEDLTRWSPFFASFEATQRCTIWVQSDSDKGRIDGQNRIVKEATPNAPRKIFFGCDPKIIPKLWNLVQLRASEVARGVKYLYLGPDRLYQPSMMRKGGEFFEYVRKVTGASVTVDSMTGDHLRIDGKGINTGTSATNPISIPSLHGENIDLTKSPSAEEIMLSNDPQQMSESQRAALAEEVIRLQIELYRDNCIRQQNWIFGRDWTLARRNTSQGNGDNASGGSGNAIGGAATAGTSSGTVSPVPTRASASTRNLTLDNKTLSNACLEIADIVSHLGHKGFMAAHAAIILYRYATAMQQNNARMEQQRGDTQLKIREIIVACTFLANKAQKKVRWKPLEDVLKAAYNMFYPGVDFDPTKEEVIVWEEKVMLAESEILDCLNYDIFYKGFDWIKTAVTESGTLSSSVIGAALAFSVSGPVLAAGSDLWLTYGAEYIFAAAVGFLDAQLESLFIDLNLIPFKVLQAAEIIAESIKNTGLGKKQSSHSLFKEGKKGLLKHIPRIKVTCARSMSQGAFGTANLSTAKSETEQRYHIIGSMNKKRRVFERVDSSIIKEFILPSLDGICAESECSIFIEKNPRIEVWDIVLQGSWRAVSIASFLLTESVQGRYEFPNGLDCTAKTDSQSAIQAKVQPGLLEMKKIETQDGWTGTIQSQVSNQSSWGRKTGGKCCVPGKIKESDLRQCGLRWWIPPRYGPSPSGSICDTFLVNGGGKEDGVLDALASLALAFQGESVAFPMLTSLIMKKKATTNSNGSIDRFIAVSLQRWPSEKVANREKTQRKKAESGKTKSSSSTKERTMQIGFSAAALQEIQMLNRLHGLIRSPQGHPNFVLPVGIALPSEVGDTETNLSLPGSKSLDLKSIDEDIFSLTRTSLENENAAERERKRKEMITGPHFVFQPTPFILQRFISKRKKRENEGDELSIGPMILAAWFHDMLSSLLHCHTNDIVLRTFSADQVMIDHSGVAKIGGLYRATVLSKEDKKRMSYKDLKEQRTAKKIKKGNDDEILKDPYVPPEMILGYPKHTKASDVWMLGCLFCHMLLGKPLYSGKDRKSLMSGLYRMIGTPAKGNFLEAIKYPFFKHTKVEKNYKPGLAKALQYMMKEDSTKHSSAIDLITQMLHLDPTMRITALGALQHEYMANYREACNSESSRKEFVRDWMLLKKRLMRSSKTDEDDAREREKGIKRKAMLMSASASKATSTTNNDDEDDLYDMDDIFKEDDPQPKKPRF